MCKCRHCGKLLTNSKSIAVGAGPKCEPRKKKVKSMATQCCFEWGTTEPLRARSQSDVAPIAAVARDAQLVDPRQLRLPNVDDFTRGSSSAIETSPAKDMEDSYNKFLEASGGKPPTMFLGSDAWFERIDEWSGSIGTKRPDYGTPTEYSYQHIPIMRAPFLEGVQLIGVWTSVSNSSVFGKESEHG